MGNPPMTGLAGYIKHLVIQQGMPLEVAAREAAQFAGQAAANQALQTVREQIQVVKQMPDPFFLADLNMTDWYPGPAEDDRFWPPYRDSLSAKGWSSKDILSLDRASTRVLQLMRPPGAHGI